MAKQDMTYSIETLKKDYRTWLNRIGRRYPEGMQLEDVIFHVEELLKSGIPQLPGMNVPDDRLPDIKGRSLIAVAVINKYVGRDSRDEEEISDLRRRIEKINTWRKYAVDNETRDYMEELWKLLKI